jgi:hypothetical protein
MKRFCQFKSMLASAGSCIAILCLLLTLAAPAAAHDDNLRHGDVVEPTAERSWHSANTIDVRYVGSKRIEVKTLSLITQMNLRPVAFSQQYTLTTPAATHDRRQVVSNVVIEHRVGGVTVTGWHARLIDSYGGGQQQRVLLQEVRITLPYSAASGGWDVRSLERELERLGVKVKPKPTAPRPTPQLSG